MLIRRRIAKAALTHIRQLSRIAKDSLLTPQGTFKTCQSYEAKYKSNDCRKKSDSNSGNYSNCRSPSAWPAIDFAHKIPTSHPILKTAKAKIPNFAGRSKELFGVSFIRKLWWKWPALLENFEPDSRRILFLRLPGLSVGQASQDRHRPNHSLENNRATT